MLDKQSFHMRFTILEVGGSERDTEREREVWAVNGFNDWVDGEQNIKLPMVIEAICSKCLSKVRGPQKTNMSRKKLGARVKTLAVLLPIEIPSKLSMLWRGMWYN